MCYYYKMNSFLMLFAQVFSGFTNWNHSKPLIYPCEMWIFYPLILCVLCTNYIVTIHVGKLLIPWIPWIFHFLSGKKNYISHPTQVHFWTFTSAIRFEIFVLFGTFGQEWIYQVWNHFPSSTTTPGGMTLLPLTIVGFISQWSSINLHMTKSLQGGPPTIVIHGVMGPL